MNSSTCTNCGLVNSQVEPICRRCGRTLASGFPQTPSGRPTSPVSHETGNSLVPDYGLGPDAYSPLRSPFGSTFSGEGGVWRDGNTLVMHKTARLPDYCIKCGIDANGSHLKRNLSWHHPALALLALAGLLVYVIVALIVRKSATIDIPVCKDHIRKHRTGIAMGWLAFLAGVGFTFFGIGQSSLGSALFGVTLVFASAIYFATFAKVVKVKKIDDSYVWLNGIDESFLSTLPSINKGW